MGAPDCGFGRCSYRRFVNRESKDRLVQCSQSHCLSDSRESQSKGEDPGDSEVAFLRQGTIIKKGSNRIFPEPRETACGTADNQRVQLYNSHSLHSLLFK